MRLVVFGPGHPFRGGIAQTTTALVRALEKRGHELIFLSARRQYPQVSIRGLQRQAVRSCISYRYTPAK